MTKRVLEGLCPIIRRCSYHNYLLLPLIKGKEIKGMGLLYD